MSASNYDRLTALGIKLNKSTGQDKTVCPRCSHTRKSANQKERCLSVNIDEGTWNCHNTGCDFSGSVMVMQKPEQKIYVRPPAWTNNTALSEKLVKWFREERGLSQRTLLDFHIGEGLSWMPPGKKGNREAGDTNTVQFPYFRNGETVNVKYRAGDKAFKMFKDAELIFFNLDAIRGKEEAIITEGEIDAMSFHEAGITNVVSVPNGASMGKMNLTYLDNCISEFDDKKRIIIAVDNDEPGRALRDELIRRLGDERCYIIDYGDHKDANELLKAKGATELEAVYKAVRPCKIEGTFTVDELLNEISDLYDNGLPPGDKLGYEELDNCLSFAPGYMTVCTGIPNHGKSDMVDYILTLLVVKRDWRVAYFSPENWPLALHLSKIIEKILGRRFAAKGNPYERITRNEIAKALTYMRDRHFFISPKDENFSLDNILEHARKLVTRYGIRGLVIDPWNTLEHHRPPGQTETEHISHQLDKIRAFNRRFGVHTVLVAHPKKIEKNKHTGKFDIPNLYSINGSANFANKADIGFTVYRDFEKNVVTLYVQKVKFRHWGLPGKIDFSYDMSCGRYNIQGHENDRFDWTEPRPENPQLQLEVSPVVTDNNGLLEEPAF